MKKTKTSCRQPALTCQAREGAILETDLQAAVRPSDGHDSSLSQIHTAKQLLDL